MESVTLRVRTPDGVTRVDVPCAHGAVAHAALYAAVRGALPAETAGAFVLSQSPSPADTGAVLAARAGSTRMERGAFVFLHAKRNTIPALPAQPDVDAAIEKLDGRVPAEDAACTHGPGAMCASCMPRDPWDASVLARHGVRHVSFHAHVRRRGGRAPDMPDYGRRACARGTHEPYPRGSCASCRPAAAVTLARQAFRMVDHVEFADGGAGIESFLSAGWRRTGRQGVAFLFGTYAHHAAPGVPLGLKAVVHGLYVPGDQEGAADGFRLGPGAAAELRLAAAAARLCGLACVGVAYTDVRRAPDGKVAHVRRADTFLVSGAEMLFMAECQGSHPYRRGSHVFSSRFVTAVVSGDADGAVGVEAYQLSAQGEALAAAGLLEATTDPAQMAVACDDSGRPLADVLYCRAAEAVRADPLFPVEYLLVSLTHGFSGQAACGLLPCKTVGALRTDADLRRHLVPFPRDAERIPGVLCGIPVIAALLRLAGFDADADAPSEWPGVQSDDLDALVALGRAVAARDVSGLAAFASSSFFQRVLARLDGSASAALGSTGAPRVSPRTSPRTAAAQSWTCAHCTFINSGAGNACAVCALPRSF